MNRFLPMPTLKVPFVPQKAVVAPQHHALERQADSMAAQVVSGQPARAGHVAPATSDGGSSSGRPLSVQQRDYFEPRFRRDFSRVRLHTNEAAQVAASAIDAQAFARGPDIAFAQGEYQPDTDAGRHLIAHELAHVVQNGQQQSQTIRRRPAKAPKKAKTVGSLTVSAASQISAARWFEMIQNSDKLTPWMKAMFAVSGDSIVLTSDNVQLPVGLNWEDVPEWFKSTLVAIKEKQWHLTTGASIVSDKGKFIHTKILADVENGDAPVGPSQVGADAIITGETVDAESLNSSLSQFGRRMPDRNATGTAKGGGRRAAAGRTPAEGLVVISNRFRDTAAAGIDVLRDDRSMLETFFHEIGAHAGLSTQGKFDESSHGLGDFRTTPITDADHLAQGVWKFFGESSRQDGIAKDMARSLGPTGQAETKAEMDKMLADLKKAVADLEAMQKQLQKQAGKK